jgi:hypothetical protein
LLLEPFRIALKMLQQTFIGSHKDGRDIDQQLSKFNTVPALVRRSEENDSVGQELDGAVFLQCTSASGVGMDKSLVE